MTQSPYTQQTSPTYQPGYVPNTGLQTAGVPNNTAWREAAIDMLAYKWATADEATRADMVSRYGQLDPTDGARVDPSTGQTIYAVSPQTNLILSQYVYSYSGGDPYLDSTLPYVPPRPDEFIEDPTTVALRVAQYNDDRNYGLSVRAQDRADRQQQLDQAYREASLASAERISAADNAAKLAAARISADAQVQSASIAAEAQRYSAELGFKSNVYNTQGNIYSNQEANRLSALVNSGNLALGLQNTYDARTRDIIANKSNPIDMVAREYSIRALKGPQGTDVPAYTNLPISDIINQQQNWKAAEAPTAPTLSAGVNATTPPTTQKKYWWQ